MFECVCVIPRNFALGKFLVIFQNTCNFCVLRSPNKLCVHLQIFGVPLKNFVFAGKHLRFLAKPCICKSFMHFQETLCLLRNLLPST